jgi:hypothetical protein
MFNVHLSMGEYGINELCIYVCIMNCFFFHIFAWVVSGQQWVTSCVVAKTVVEGGH